jgi:type II restriction/modification system DNA methylase subunit YeeA
MNPDATTERMEEFVAYWGLLKGDEKGEAQVFCDRLFRAFGHGGYKEAGAALEYRVKGKGEPTKYADLRWGSRLLLEMKGRGEELGRHYRQAFDYWIRAVPKRPRYVILCNFDEFWIYDFDLQLDDPVDTVKVTDLPERYTALNFLFAEEKQPIFRNDLVAVTRAAAAKVAAVFNSMTKRGEPRDRAQRFILQCVMAMFSEDFGLLPRGLFSELLQECQNGASSYDLLGSLFRQMNSPSHAHGGRYKDVRYFNGGLFATVKPIDLLRREVDLMAEASSENWSKVKPAIFGTLFQDSMDKDERHAYGAHFTSEVDINKVVSATIEFPWRERLGRTSSLKDLYSVKEDLLNFRVLDPACGSGNFLYLAFLQLRRIENDLVAKVNQQFGKRATARLLQRPFIGLRQFFGIDNYQFAVELAKVTLILAKEIALKETARRFSGAQIHLLDRDLPLDNLEKNIRCEDALLCKEWPKADAIIGNPPYQSKNKIQQELGAKYIRHVREKYPDVPGRADYCVYWFRRAHEELAEGGRAGLVGTNTIRQNYSREGALDYIVQNGGTITEAVSTQVWSGDAVVHVSIVNWIKGDQKGPKKLYSQLGDLRDSPWSLVEVSHINSALSTAYDVTTAEAIQANIDFDGCDQGQTHGHEGFVLSANEGAKLISANKRNADVLFPYLIGDELLGLVPPHPTRYVIDFHPLDIAAASSYIKPFERIKTHVLPSRKAAAKKEEQRNKEVLQESPDAHVNLHHRNFLNKWWLLSYPRAHLIRKLRGLCRYIVCSRVTKRPVFEFVDTYVRPNDALQVFVLSDDYSFGVLQSGVHWEWFSARCSTLKGDPRYTSNSVFDTFPWPQQPTTLSIRKVAECAVALRRLRRKVIGNDRISLRELYRTLDLPGDNPLREAHDLLDAAVRKAYGMKPKDDVLPFLLKLNRQLRAKEARLSLPVGPGLPPSIKSPPALITTDRIVSTGYDE